MQSMESSLAGLRLLHSNVYNIDYSYGLESQET